MNFQKKNFYGLISKPFGEKFHIYRIIPNSLVEYAKSAAHMYAEQYENIYISYKTTSLAICTKTL